MEEPTADMKPPPRDPPPRQSVTDACIDWPTTEPFMREAHVRYQRVIEKARSQPLNREP